MLNIQHFNLPCTTRRRSMSGQTFCWRQWQRGWSWFQHSLHLSSHLARKEKHTCLNIIFAANILVQKEVWLQCTATGLYSRLSARAAELIAQKSKSQYNQMQCLNCIIMNYIAILMLVKNNHNITFWPYCVALLSTTYPAMDFLVYY